VPDDVWARTQLLYVCSPGNPTGAVMPLGEWEKLFELSDRHGFVIASDECYSEIYFRDEPPLGGLEAAHGAGPADFRNLIALTSLSKRSNVPGMRSGFVAGDAALIKPVPALPHLPRQRHEPGGAGGQHRGLERRGPCRGEPPQYREKFARITPLLAEVMDVALPDAGFYLWAGVPENAAATPTSPGSCYALYNVTVLPGSFLAREAARPQPGPSRIRMALVAEKRRVRGSCPAHRPFRPKSRT
jgi:N-succinyldiaminopimelate aminotransferase